MGIFVEFTPVNYSTYIDYLVSVINWHNGRTHWQVQNLARPLDRESAVRINQQPLDREVAVVQICTVIGKFARPSC